MPQRCHTRVASICWWRSNGMPPGWRRDIEHMSDSSNLGRGLSRENLLIGQGLSHRFDASVSIVPCALLSPFRWRKRRALRGGIVRRSRWPLPSRSRFATAISTSRRRCSRHCGLSPWPWQASDVIAWGRGDGASSRASSSGGRPSFEQPVDRRRTRLVQLDQPERLGQLIPPVHQPARFTR